MPQFVVGARDNVRQYPQAAAVPVQVPCRLTGGRHWRSKRSAPARGCTWRTWRGEVKHAVDRGVAGRHHLSMVIQPREPGAAERTGCKSASATVVDP